MRPTELTKKPGGETVKRLLTRHRHAASNEGGTGSLARQTNNQPQTHTRSENAIQKITESTDEVDGIPVRWAAADAPDGLALWLTHLGGSAGQTQPMLTQLADRGLLAVSFDPPGHGRRSDGRTRWSSGGRCSGPSAPGCGRWRDARCSSRYGCSIGPISSWETPAAASLAACRWAGTLRSRWPAPMSASRGSPRSSPPLTGRALACGCSTTRRSSSTRARLTVTRSGSTTLSIR